MANYSVTLQSSNENFTVRPDELILDAAIRQGITIAYSCRNGTCRTCIFGVMKGTVQQLDADVCMISQQELESNKRLLCMSVCKRDVILETLSSRRRS